MKKNLVLFLTHNFKPIFTKTLKLIDSLIDSSFNAIILYDNNSKDLQKIELNNIDIIRMTADRVSYDSFTIAHNFVLRYLYENPELLKIYDYIWVIENDVYFHGNLKYFINYHDSYTYDLLVPEFGVRPPGWMWIPQLTGIKNKQQIGVTAVIHRISNNFAKYLIDGYYLNKFSGHIEALLPHLCLQENFTIQQFCPDLCCSINTFRSKFLDLIEKDILNNTNFYIEHKLYHPIKL
jgi:hypothetical protein